MTQFFVVLGAGVWATVSCFAGMILGYLFVPLHVTLITEATRSEIYELAGVGILVFILLQGFVRSHVWTTSRTHPWMVQEVILFTVIPAIVWVFFPDFPIAMTAVLFLMSFSMAYQDFSRAASK